MNPIKTLAAAAMAMTMSSDLATAWDGSVTFYQDANFGGSSHRVTFSGSDSNDCLTFGCFNDVASSARWDGIPRSNAIGGPIHVQFYTDAQCGGTMKRWKSTDIPPSNFQLDGINDQISSLMITEITNSATGYEDLICTKSMMEKSGLDSYVSVVKKTNATAPHVVN